jgi:hypothetical protein
MNGGRARAADSNRGRIEKRDVILMTSTRRWPPSLRSARSLLVLALLLHAGLLRAQDVDRVSRLDPFDRNGTHHATIVGVSSTTTATRPSTRACG